MPAYDFDCHNCGQMLEEETPDPGKCPECGSALTRFFSPTPYHAKTSPMHPNRGRGLNPGRKLGVPVMVRKRVERQNAIREEYLKRTS